MMHKNATGSETVPLVNRVRRLPLQAYPMSNRERRRRRRQQSDHLLVFGASADPKAEPALLAAYPPALAVPPSIATFCFPSGALPPAEQGAPRFSCNVVSTPAKRVHICCLAFREPSPSADTTEGSLKCLCVLSSSERIFQLRSYLHGLHRLFLGDVAAIAAQPKPDVGAAPATAEQRHSGEGGSGGDAGGGGGGCTDARSRRQARRQRSEGDEGGGASLANEGVVFEAWLLERLRAGQADILPPSAAAVPPCVPDADADTDANDGEGLPAGSAWEEWCCAALLQLAGPELLGALLGAAVQERSILLMADDSLSLTAAAVALCSLLSPLTWQGSFLPVLPRRLREELLQAPVPFIFGLPSGALDVTELSRASPHLVCVDLTARKLLFAPAPAASPMPAALRRPFLAQLSAAAERLPPPPSQSSPDGAPARLQLPSDPEAGEAGGGWRGAGAAVRSACLVAMRELAGAARECARLGGGMDAASRELVAARWAAPKERAFVLALLESQQASALVEPLLAAQEGESAAAAAATSLAAAAAAAAATGGAGAAIAAAPTPAAPARALSMRAAALAARLAVGMQQVKASTAAATNVAEGGGGSSVVRLHAAWSEARQELLERDGSARAGNVLHQLDADIERLCCESEAAQLAPTQSPPP